MRSRLLGVSGVFVAALVGWSCAAGGVPVPGQEDGGKPHDAAADVETGDGPAQSDVAVAEDAQLDGQLDGQHDGGQSDGQTDGLLLADRHQEDGGACNVVNTGNCDPVCQNCGSGGTQKCSINSLNPQQAACMANGSVGSGGTCTGDSNGDNCSAGFICLNEGKCLQYCRADGDCLAYNGACILGILWGGTTSTPFKACKSPDGCDPVANTGCTSGGCFLYSNDLQTFCVTAGTGGQGADCTSVGCQGGYLCVDRGSGYKCQKVCTLNPPGSCPTGTCQSVGGLTNYGSCA
jgi:hypothetical protein